MNQQLRLAAHFARDHYRLPRWRGGELCQPDRAQPQEQRAQQCRLVAGGLQPSEERAHQHRQHSGQRRAGKGQHHVVAVNAEQNQVAQPARANQRCQRRRADDEHGSGADARNNRRQRHRQLNPRQRLRARQAESGVRFLDGGVNLAQTQQGVLENRQQGVKRERNQHRRRANADQRNQQPQQSQRRNRLQHAGALQYQLGRAALLGQPHGKRHGNDNRRRQRQRRQPQVLQHCLPQISKRKRVHRPAPYDEWLLANICLIKRGYAKPILQVALFPACQKRLNHGPYCREICDEYRMRSVRDDGQVGVWGHTVSGDDGIQWSIRVVFSDDK